MVYYNEIDKAASAWLRELIKQNLIAPGEVDERDIRDVTPNDLKGFTQHHFFAGIGVWSYALRIAGWPDERPVWTGSCPCQPFSQAGLRRGTHDERHVWPAWHWLVKECKPDVIFGEQVASKDGLAWLDLVSTDLEGEGYAVGPVILPACGVGAPHIRSRLWVVAKRLADSGRVGLPKLGEAHDFDGSHECRDVNDGRGEVGALRLAYSSSDGVGQHARKLLGDETQHEVGSEDGNHTPEPSGPTRGHWQRADWLPCRDGKLRPVEPGTFPLAHGPPERVGLLRGYGNAIVAQAAAEVISAAMECIAEGAA